MYTFPMYFSHPGANIFQHIVKRHKFHDKVSANFAQPFFVCIYIFNYLQSIFLPCALTDNQHDFYFEKREFI